MIIWRIRFDNVPGEGYLLREDLNSAEALIVHEDGTPAPEVTGYTTLDTEPEPPVWAA